MAAVLIRSSTAEPRPRRPRAQDIDRNELGAGAILEQRHEVDDRIRRKLCDFFSEIAEGEGRQVGNRKAVFVLAKLNARRDKRKS